MTPRPRVLVISSCTSRKMFTAGGPADPNVEEGRSRAARTVAAEDLYAGEQHRRLMKGIRAARDAGRFEIDLRIVSAGHGLVHAEDLVATYEASFQGMPRDARRELSAALGLPRALAKALAEPYALGLLLLGGDYLDACAPDSDLRLGGRVLAFCAASTALRLPACERMTAIPLSKEHARRFRCGQVGLKGEVAGRLLAELADEPHRLAEADLARGLLGRLVARGPVPPAQPSATRALF